MCSGQAIGESEEVFSDIEYFRRIIEWRAGAKGFDLCISCFTTLVRYLNHDNASRFVNSEMRVFFFLMLSDRISHAFSSPWVRHHQEVWVLTLFTSFFSVFYRCLSWAEHPDVSDVVHNKLTPRSSSKCSEQIIARGWQSWMPFVKDNLTLVGFSCHPLHE